MTWLVVYDISDDDVRTRVAKVCERFGDRVQEAVFECRLDRPGLDRLKAALPAALGRPESGQIRVYRVCADCMTRAFGYGTVSPSPGSEPVTFV